MILVLAASLVCVSAIGTFSFIAAKRHVQEMRDFAYIGSVNRVKEYIRNNLKYFELELKFLIHLQPVRGIIRDSGNNGYDSPEGIRFHQWIRQLQNVFEQDALVHDRLVKISLIDASGMELVRVERTGNDVRIAAMNELQDRSLQPYFKETMKRGPNETYLSPIGPDREAFGTATPPEPVIRYTAPVFDTDKNLRGALTMVFSGRDILSVQHMFMTSQGHEVHEAGSVFIADQAGYYLYHSRFPTKEWGGEQYLNTGEGLRKDYPEFAPDILSGQEGLILSGKREIFYSSFRISDRLTLIVGLDTLKRVIEAPLYQFRDFLFYVILGVLGMTWFFSAIFVRRILESLYTLTAATKQIATGDLKTEITVKTSDEILDLASGFNTMIHALRRKTERLTGLYELGIYKGKDSVDLADRIVTFIVSTTGSRVAVLERIDGNKCVVTSLCQGGLIHHGGSFDLEGTVSAKIVSSRNAYDCSNVPEKFPLDSFLREHKIDNFVGAPILSGKRETLGVVALMNNNRIEARKEDVGLLYTLSRIMAFEWEQEIHLTKIKDLPLETIHRLSRAAE